jgi:hypothetical protein
LNLQTGQDSIFSIATMLYARLRKVNSRVIDVAYLMQDRSYAHHVITIALETKDAELASYVDRLRQALDLPDDTIERKAGQSHDKQDVNKKGNSAKHDEGHVSFSLF